MHEGELLLDEQRSQLTCFIAEKSPLVTSANRCISLLSFRLTVANAWRKEVNDAQKGWKPGFKPSE